MLRLAALVLAPALACAQTAPPSAAPSNPAIRIDVNLVQVDAVVTDSHGRRVPGLQASDFELLQDGKPQSITNFSYVSRPAPALPRSTAPKLAKGDVPPPPPVLQPTDVGRTLAFIVDDQGLAAENIPSVRDAIRHFVDNEMRTDDLVAIVRTGAGMGALQQFTTDKRLLYEALARVKYGESRVGTSSFAPLGSTPTGRGARGAMAIDHLREDTFAAGSLGAIQFVVNSMAGLPGRKSVVLFTENIRMIYRNAPNVLVEQAVRELSDAASRANVVIHAIDPRGLPDLNLTSQDDTSRVSSRRASRVPQQREMEVVHTEEGMFALSEATGGLFLRNLNDLAAALRTAAADSDGYYLLGYHPDSATFERNDGQPRFHRLEVRARRAGLKVRSRDGFLGEPGSATGPSERTRDAELTRALESPYAGSIHPKLTALFSNAPPDGSFISAWIHFEAGDLKWSTEPDGSRKASVDVAAVAYDDDGLALASINTTFPLHLDARQFAYAGQQGMVYAFRIPVSKAGPYLIRTAMRDPATEGAGAAEQFVEAPDVANGHLALSGVILEDAAPSPAPDGQPGPGPYPDTTAGAARRAFRRGEPLAYSYEILNATAGAGQHPELEVQTRVFHDGTQVLADKSAVNVPADVKDRTHLRASGHMTLGAQIGPGEYVLQVIVTDKLAKAKYNLATQSVDFEIR